MRLSRHMEPPNMNSTFSTHTRIMPLTTLFCAVSIAILSLSLPAKAGGIDFDRHPQAKNNITTNGVALRFGGTCNEAAGWEDDTDSGGNVSDASIQCFVVRPGKTNADYMGSNYRGNRANYCTARLSRLIANGTVAYTPVTGNKYHCEVSGIKVKSITSTFAPN